MGIIDNTKELVGLVQKVGDRDLYRKIVSLEDEVIAITRDNRQLKAKVEELEQALKLKGELGRRDQFYWLEGDETPFCPKCWETENRTVHLYRTVDSEVETCWDCLKCALKYVVKKRRDNTIGIDNLYPSSDWMSR
jgi:hypothetical protein